MTLAFPLALGQLADLLPVRAVNWMLRQHQELSGLGSGQILAVELAPPLWEAKVEIDESRHAVIDGIQARLEALDGSIRSFYIYDPKRRFPQFDPRGQILGGVMPTIQAIAGDNRSIALQGLPVGYRLAVGDFLAFDYGASARRAFHRVVEPAIAANDGMTAPFEIRPHVRPGANVGIGVALINPSMKCILQPGSLDAGTTRSSHSRLSFSVIQKL